jgi:hypothetical protein
MRMAATAPSVGGTTHHRVDVDGRHAITTDLPERLGGDDAAVTAHAFLPAMLAACVSSAIGVYARSQQSDLGNAKVGVEATPSRRRATSLWRSTFRTD